MGAQHMAELSRLRGVGALLGALAATVSVASCVDESPRLREGEVEYVLASPRADEGGMLVRIEARLAGAPWSPGARSEAAATGDATLVAAIRRTPGELRLVVPLEPGAAEPRLTLLQVVAPDDRLRTDLDRYRLERVR